MQTNGSRFIVRSGNAFLNGFVAFPKAPKLIAIDPSQSPKYQPLFDKQALGLKVLEIHPSGRDEGRGTSGEEQRAKDRLVEFLVVMRVGLGEVPTMSVMPQVRPESIGATVQTGKRRVQVVFDRSDICGGTLSIWDKGRKVIPHRLREQVNDTYENWRTDPRYQRWRTESRFDFLAVR